MMLLEITNYTNLLIVFGVILLIIIWKLYESYRIYKKKSDDNFIKFLDLENQIKFNKQLFENEKNQMYKDFEGRFKVEETLRLTKLNEQELIFLQKEAELKVSFQNWALTELEKFKELEIINIKNSANQEAVNKALVDLQKWKSDNELRIRQDAIQRSYSVNLGKIT